MTFVHPSGAAVPARIRILGTDPPPPPPRRGPSRGLLVACAVVAALGVGITLLARPQISEAPSPDTLNSETIVPMGLLNLGARLPDTRALRVLSMDSPDFDSAARIEASRHRVTPTPTAAVGQVPAAPGPAAGVPSSTGSQPSSVPATTAGPDQPPNPTSPNTFLDPS